MKIEYVDDGDFYVIDYNDPLQRNTIPIPIPIPIHIPIPIPCPFIPGREHFSCQ